MKYELFKNQEGRKKKNTYVIEKVIGLLATIHHDGIPELYFS